MKNELAIRLPEPDSKVYFPERDPNPSSSWKREWALDKAGEKNLVLALGYGSQVTGDPSHNSMYDFILVVNDTEAFHRKVLASNPEDYGSPKSVWWHTRINRGPSYYQTTISDGEHGETRAKYAVISEKNFIKGCNGSLRRKDRQEPGGFGLTIAGRVQKVALVPLYETDNVESKENIERAINKARIDGVWLALGTLGKNFTMSDLLQEYVSLSYRFDVRKDKPDKDKIIISKSPIDYQRMMLPILDAFSKKGIIEQSDDLRWTKKQSPTEGEIFRRKWALKVRTTARNYMKNAHTVGLGRGVAYVKEKLERAKV